jgi:hypothetical protein
MKKNLILLTITALISSVAFSRIWRVNNNPGVTADFTTAQAAHDAPGVLAGDTIHLEPSVTTYGGVVASKRLVWISTGNFLSIHANQQYSPNQGRLDFLQAFALGSENSVFHVNVEGAVSLGASGVRIDRCLIGGSIDISNYTGNASNIVIINSYIRGHLNIYAHNNNIVSNNIFEGTLFVGNATALAIISHNVFNAVSNVVFTVENSTLENNIFSKANSAISFTNCTVQYNMSGAAGVLPSGNNNQNNITMSTVFIDDNGTDDASYVLKPGSPAIGAGTLGVNLGAFGGSSPFKLALQPPVPAIYKILAPVAPTGNTMNVTFSTKSNN